MAPVITTGAPGPVVCRQELRTFLKDKDLTNLFLLALDDMMGVDQADPNSWFQVGAIHGRPYIPYDNIGTKGSFGGYCCHSSTLFPPWHRPFLALLEQMLAERVKTIASHYVNHEDKERYTKAADRFRLPFWDWALEAPLPAIVANEKKVTCHLPNGKTEEMDNPLYGYKFHPVYSDFGDGLPNEKVWEAWTKTVRYPTTEDAKAESVPETLQATLKNNQFTLRDRCYNILTRVTTYNRFSHDGEGDGINPGKDGVDSIESIHNQMHVLGGRNGHMGEVEYAAFDPLFWLHHGNVDRIFALWQALNPDEWINALPSSMGTFTRPKGAIEDGKSQLTPFRKTVDTFWTSDEVRDCRVFNYTYPELYDLYKLPPKECAAKVRLAVNKLYGKTAPVSAAKPSTFKDLAPPKADAGHNVAPGKWHAAAEDKKHYHEWFANIDVKKYGLKKSFMVHIFLGEPPSDASKWATHPGLVGTHCVFATNITFTGCEKCHAANAEGLVVHGSIPLTHALGNHFGNVTSLEPNEVLPYLNKELHYTCQRIDGTAVPNKDVPGLKVTVGSAVVEVPDHPEHFPTWRDATHHISHILHH